MNRKRKASVERSEAEEKVIRSREILPEEGGADYPEPCDAVGDAEEYLGAPDDMPEPVAKGDPIARVRGTNRPPELTGETSIRDLIEILQSIPPGRKTVSARLRRLAGDMAKTELTEDAGVAYRLLAGVREALSGGAKELASWEQDCVPWPEAVNIAEVMREAERLIAGAMYCPPEVALVAAYFSALTWFAESLHVAPYLLITAPSKRCGKSRLLELIQRLSRRPFPSSSISAAVIFRACEKWSPTLLLDEVETYLKKDPEIEGILNAGYKRATAFVPRCDGDKNEVKNFPCFGLKVFAGINAEKLSDTLSSRTIVLKLEQRPKGSPKLQALHKMKPETFETLGRKFARIAEEHGETVGKADIACPEELDDRAAEIWEPLFALADLAGDGARLRAAAVSISETAPKSEDRGAELLGNIGEVLDNFKSLGSGSRYEITNSETHETRSIQLTEVRGVTWVSSSDLATALAWNDDWRWGRYAHGKALTAHMLTRRLGTYEVASQNLKVLGNKRAYCVTSLREAIEKWGKKSDDAVPLE